MGDSMEAGAALADDLEIMARTPPSTSRLERCATVERTCTGHLARAAALLVVALVACTAFAKPTEPLIAGGALAVCLFAVLALAAAAAVRREAIDAVARGDVRAVAAHAPARLDALTSARNRHVLSRTLLRALRSDAPLAQHDLLLPARRQFRHDPRLRSGLDDIVGRLAQHDASPVGVALVHQLVTDPASPLYGGAADDLRARLMRISQALATDRAAPSGF